MSGRAATTDVIEGKYALAVGIPEKKLAPGWQWKRLTDVAEMATGHTPSRNHPEYWDGEIAWIGIKDAREFHGRRITTTFQTVTQAGIDNSASVLLPKNTVCLSRTASVGYVTIMDRPMATSQDFVNWKCSEALVPEFLMYLLIAERDSLFKFGKGTTHTTIYFPEAKALAAGLPPPAEQRRIVAKIEELFSDLDAGVAALERVRTNLKRYRAAVLKAAVEGWLTAAWRDHNPTPPDQTGAALLRRILAERRAKWEQDQLRKFKEAGKTPPKGWKEKYKQPLCEDQSAPFDIPATWQWASADQLAEFVTDGDHNPPPRVPVGVPHLTAKHIKRGQIIIEDCSFVSPADYERTALRYKARTGDVIVTCVGTVGAVAVVPDAAPVFSADRNLAAIRLIKPGVSAAWVGMVLTAPWWQRSMRGASGSTAQPHLYLGDLRALLVPVPPLAEQAEIVAEVDRRLSVADAAEQQVEHALQRAARLRQSILKRAFEGKLVPQDPADPPAAILLERAKAQANGHRSAIETGGVPGRHTPALTVHARGPG